MVSKFPLDPQRLQNSQIWQICKAYPFVTRGAINLWIAANSAKHLGKLPDDDFALAHMADVSVEDLKLHRDLFLHGFVKDGKGNLLHPVVIEIGSQKSRPAKRKTEAYSSEFEVIWAAFQCGDNCPGASKIDAWDAYQQITPPTPSAADLRGLVQTYLSLCRSRATKVCHPATFFRQRRWEGLASAPMFGGVDDASRAMKAWGGLAKPFVEAIGVAPFLAYFDGSSIRRGPPFTISVHKEFVKSQIERKFSSQIAAQFGRFKVEVVQKAA